MKKYFFILLFTFFISAFCHAQKIIGDCTLTYQVNAENNILDSNVVKSARKIFYVSGGKSTSEIVFNGFQQETIYNENAPNVNILFNYDGQKYMSVLTKDEWKEQYKNYENASIQATGATEIILGYKCKKIVISLTDGTQINVSYTPDLKTTAPDNPYEFEKINGLILKYEAIVQKYKITYTASKIDFNPVPAEKFTIPKTGYRVLNFKDKN